MFRKFKRKLVPGDTNSVHSVKDNDDAPLPKEIYNWKLFLTAVTASAAAVIIGYDAGFIGGTVSLASFQDEFGFAEMSSSERTLILSNVVSVFQAGAFWGAIFMYPVGELLGRKIGLLISGFLLTFGAAISLVSNLDRGLGAIYAGRVITGLGIGGCSGLAPIYVSEISPVAIRGRLIGCWEVSWQVGGIIGYWINYGVLQNIPASRKQWIIPFAVQLIPSGLFWAGVLFLPESPRFLVSKGKIEKAYKNMSFLQDLPEDHPYLQGEMNNIIRDFDDRQAKLGSTGFFAPIRKVIGSKKLLYRLLLSTSLFPMQNGSGINAITYYSPTVFKSLGVSGLNAGLRLTGIFGILKGFALIVWIFFIVDNFGRRTALIWGSIPCSLTMWFIGAYVKIADPAKSLANGDTKMTAGGRAAQAMLYLWTIFYGASWNGTPWCINAEIFSQEIRTLTQAINASLNWFWAFIWGRFTGNAFNSMGYGLYFLFALCMVVFPIVVFLIYPETKEVPLEAVDYLFEVPAWRAHQYALDKFRKEFAGDRNETFKKYEKGEREKEDYEESKTHSDVLDQAELELESKSA